MGPCLKWSRIAYQMFGVAIGASKSFSGSGFVCTSRRIVVESHDWPEVRDSLMIAISQSNNLKSFLLGNSIAQVLRKGPTDGYAQRYQETRLQL